MTRTTKLTIGALTMVPWLWSLFFVFGSMVTLGPEASVLGIPFEVFVGVHLGVVIGAMALICWFVVHVVRQPKMEGWLKVVWVICLFQLNMLVLPVYWYQHIWRTQ